MVGPEGFEPSTNGLKAHCSTAELRAHGANGTLCLRRVNCFSVPLIPLLTHFWWGLKESNLIAIRHVGYSHGTVPAAYSDPKTTEGHSVSRAAFLCPCYLAARYILVSLRFCASIPAYPKDTNPIALVERHGCSLDGHLGNIGLLRVCSFETVLSTCFCKKVAERGIRIMNGRPRTVRVVGSRSLLKRRASIFSYRPA